MKQSNQSRQSKGGIVERPIHARPQTVAEAYVMARDWSGAIETMEPKMKQSKHKKPPRPIPVAGSTRKGDSTMKFMGEDMAQAWPDLLIWEAMFNEYPLRSFIELGTGHGGLALFFALQCFQRGIEFYTFDNQRPVYFDEPLPKAMGLRERFHFVDIFKEGHAEITGLIAGMPKPLGIFFDDGDKPREWATYAPFTSPGDVLAVHDWGTEFKEADIGSVSVVRILGRLSDGRPSGWKAMWFQRV
jgi:hypothetical protein